MTAISSFDEFASLLRAFIAQSLQHAQVSEETDAEFNGLAMALFSLQIQAVPVYRRFCEKRNVSSIAHWREIPALPTSAFKDFEVTSLTTTERTRVFHSSGTTRQQAGRHFHNTESLAIYEDSVRPWFRWHFSSSLPCPARLLILTPSPALAPHSSLAHMFDTVRTDFASSLFTGQVGADGAWTLDLGQTLSALNEAQTASQPVALLGAAFSFVHLLDYCRATRTRFRLPVGSRLLETGGYKGRSRTVTKAQLRGMMTRDLGIPETHILAEYGMSELSSQAYDHVISEAVGAFRFPPWARARIISPETGREVEDGEAGLVQIVDLANARSVLAVQTEDLAVRHKDGFELIGRAADAAARGCSLQLQETEATLA